MPAEGGLRGFNSLEFQVILFLRQELVERYIGVDGVNFNALGYLDTVRQGRESGEIRYIDARGRETSAGGIKERATITLLSSAAFGASAGVGAPLQLSSSSFSTSTSGTETSEGGGQGIVSHGAAYAHNHT